MTEAKVDGRSTDTRQRILQRAKEAYYRGGYAGINLQELAETIGISKAALFHHFKSKQVLFFEIQLDICKNHQVLMQAAIVNGSDTRSRLRNVLIAIMGRPFFDPMKFLADEFQQLNPQQQQLVSQAFELSTSQPIEAILEMGVQNGELRAHYKKMAMSIFLNLTMMLPTEGNPVTGDMPQSQHAQYVDQLLDLFLYGVAQNLKV